MRKVRICKILKSEMNLPEMKYKRGNYLKLYGFIINHHHHV